MPDAAMAGARLLVDPAAVTQAARQGTAVVVQQVVLGAPVPVVLPVLHLIPTMPVRVDP